MLFLNFPDVKNVENFQAFLGKLHKCEKYMPLFIGYVNKNEFPLMLKADI